MARFKKFTQKKNEGKIVYGDKIVNEIVLIALADIPSAELYSYKPNAKSKGKAVNVYFEKEGVRIDVVVRIHYSQSVSDMAFKVQEIVRHTVESMTDYHVSTVNVIVKDVMFVENRASDKAEEEKKSEDEPINGGSESAQMTIQTEESKQQPIGEQIEESVKDVENK